MKIALIAHDKKKDRLVEFVKENESFFQQHELCSTGTTGKRIMEETNLTIHRYESGPLGGDQQIGALVAIREIDLMFFFRDPLTSQPHEPDVNALLRLCDVVYLPVATNEQTAEALVYYYQKTR